MAKRKAKRRRRISQRTVFIPDKETRSSSLPHPNATLTPDASLESQTSGQLLSKDSTNAPQIGEESEEQERYAETQAALIDKYVLSRHSIPFLIAFCVIGYIFIQDNGAGKLTSWQGIWWTLQKSSILLGLFLIISLCQFLFKKIFRKKI